MPLVSVVVPTHNRPAMLAEALTSVRAQTLTDYEIIVVSNGESAEMQASSRQVTTDHRGRFLALDRGNVSAARNFGIQHAKGEWIALLDDDDLWLPTKLERQMAEAMRTGADMISCDYIKFLPDGSETIERARLCDGWSHVKAINHLYWWANPSAVLIRKTACEQVGGFDPRQRYCEDNDMWRRISWHHAIHHVEDVLMRYRSGHPSMMQHERLRYLFDLRYFAKMYLDTPDHLRSTLPTAAAFLPHRIEAIFIPKCLTPYLSLWRQFRRLLSPRTRWARFRDLLRPRTRICNFTIN